MSAIERVRVALRELGLPAEVTEFPGSTRTAVEAAAVVGCEQGQIVKSLFFLADGRPTMVLAAGDRQVDTALVAEMVGVPRKRLRMGTAEEVEETTGYAVGGVAPVGLRKPCDMLVDDGLKRYERVWVAGGAGNALFSIETETLVRVVHGQWAAVCREVAA